MKMKRLLTTSSSSRRIHRRLARRARRGFTLVELMISLVMGLIIALAAIALAKSSTTAFHEQARMSGVEMTLRAASERFRADLMKASYMSTPNIHLDRRIARIPGAPPNYRVPALLDLQGLYVDVGAGQIRTQGTLNLATRLENSGGGGSPLAPDDVYIAGNMTSDDMYRGQWVDVGSCPGAGARLRLSGLADPAVLRMYNGALAGPDQVKAAQAVFTPGERMTPPVLNKQYAVQVMDMRGCFHYLTVCAVSQGNDPNSVFVDLQGAGANSILTPDDTKDTCGGRLMEEFSIAPVSRVKWYLSSQDEHMVSPAPDPRLIDKVLDTPNGPGTASNKFNLYRQLLAAD
jgi:prepilin-type N-terminal cleavage/methylation domain-containing protein